MSQRVEPYLFEPLMTSKELESVHERLGNERERQEQGRTELSEVRSGHNGWCSRGNCPAMTTEMESVCCKEVPEILQKMGTHVCITDHLSFDVVCLDPEVLQTALVAMRDVCFEDFDVPVPQQTSRLSSVHLVDTHTLRSLC